MLNFTPNLLLFCIFSAFWHKKCWIWLFWLAFEVRSTQTLVEIYNKYLSLWLTHFTCRANSLLISPGCILIVGCRCEAQLGDLVLGFHWEVPLRLRLVSLFYSLKVPLKLKKNKGQMLDFVVTLYFISLCSNGLCTSKVQKCEDLKIISQIIGFSKDCDLRTM